MGLKVKAFDIALKRAVEHDGGTGVLGGCDLAGVFRRAPSTREVVREVKTHTIETLTAWLHRGVLASKLLSGQYCTTMGVARSEERCRALENGVGDRLLAKVERSPEGCWIWAGHAGRGHTCPQPKLGLGGTSVSARRAAVELTYGAVPDGIQIFNICGDQLCLAPEHQGARPQRWNVQQVGHPSGIHCGNARINFEIAQEIREAYTTQPRRVRGGRGVSLVELAAQHDISISTVRQVLTGRTWRRPDEGGGA
ncbi:hypothetical protein LCGC14_0461570 [marine sediment metagenome]|uniref:Uncharacterized protein n=1 Tax=marine sediment metagenome TaxID=412755 RepID=A0A0F9SK23_9ZZZZ